MKTKILLLLLLCTCFAKAQNIEVSGLQSGIWEADTVFVTGDIIVANTLNIAAGTTVIFDGFYSIRVEDNATLHALGTRTDSICFTVTDTTHFHVFNSGRGGWNGIRLEKAGPSKFDYCRFQYAKAALDGDKDGGALRIYNCQEVEINHSTLFCNFSRQHGGALNAEHSNVTIHDCNVSHNLNFSGDDAAYYMYGGGLRFINCEVELTGTNFHHNTGVNAIGGALSLDSCAVNIDRCKFEHNYGINGGGLYLIRSNHLGRGSITNSLFVNNISGHFGAGLALCDASPWIENLTVVNNHSIGVNCGGIFFYQYCEPILWNCIIYGNTNEAPLEEPVQMWAWIYEESKLQFYNCLVQYGLENITNNEAVSVYLNCLDEDPLFVDHGRENYHLSANSPCIDAGYTFETEDESLDLDGLWRVCGERTDIGAYEYSEAGISESSQNKKLMYIVGNPITAASYAEIEVEKAGELTANIYSMNGKLLVNKPLGYAQTGINRIEIGEMFQQLASGTYLFVVRNTEKRMATKVIKP
jgi:hypothetical protein